MNQKHYLITGATAGIGLATAKKLAASGHRLTITGRDTQRLHSAATEIALLGDGDVIPQMCDFGDLSQITTMAKALHSDGITFDGLVLNAGIFLPQPFSDLTEANVDQTMAVNFKGPLFTLNTLLPCLKHPASVVFVSSLVVRKAFEGAAVYSASKAAFEAAARVLNLELATKGIRINSIRPGVTATEIQRKAGMNEEQIAGLMDAMKGTPLGRVLAPEEMGEAIAYLLSDASAGMRDAYLDIDGGHAL
ncbi:SDR family NAD(P)-dependent oxidoreductase [Microbulbifer aggregans]|uniref:SDR family NAD(P)-dependent oxidoreductase n=1 Tax=Microbulbifer aggregans TaxID=1769779 RepID=UPI001CFC531B|nr:SDR family oxidoreductase [Microbulbifer aggregans]